MTILKCVSCATVGVILVWMILLFAVPRTVASAPAPAPPQSVVEVTASSIPGVDVVAVESDSVSPILVDNAKNNQFVSFRRYVAVLKNRSLTGIKEVTVSWALTSSSGATDTTYSITDAFDILQLNSQEAVVRPGSDALILPSGVTSSNYLEKIREKGRHPIFSVPGPDFINKLNGASKVTISLDTVIFGNGEVWGPNQAQTAESTEARNIAARQVAQQAFETLKAGGDVDALLNGLSDGAPTSLSTTRMTVAGWIPQLAQQIRNLPQRKLFLEKVNQLRPLPQFVRKG